MVRGVIVFAKAFWRMSLGLVAGFALYVGAAVWSAKLPEGARLQASTASLPPLALCHDAIHSDFAFTLDEARARLPEIAAHLPPNLAADKRVLIGWGDYEFFTKITTLEELDAGVASRALLGLNPAALRVQVTYGTWVTDACVPLTIDTEGRAALAKFIAASLIVDAAPLPPGRYGELYLPATGRYSPLQTCNQWTARAMREAGLARARFAPFSFGVVWPLAATQK